MNKLSFEVAGSKYYVRLPNQREMNEGDLVYKTKYSEALRFGALTNAEALRIIEERKIYNKDDEEKVRKLFFQLHELGKKLIETEKFQDAAIIIFDMEKVRTEIIGVTMRKNNVLDNTAESYADEHRLQYYTVACTFTEDNKQVFKSIEEYLDRAGEELAKIAITKTIHLIANGGKDFRWEWPEYQWRMKHGLIDDNLMPVPGKAEELINSAKAEIDTKIAETVETKKRSKKK